MALAAPHSNTTRGNDTTDSLRVPTHQYVAEEEYDVR